MSGRLENFSVDQAAGASVLLLTAVGGLISIILKSRCECDLNFCWIWRCHRKPPPLEPEPEPEPEAPKIILPPNNKEQDAVGENAKIPRQPEEP